MQKSQPKSYMMLLVQPYQVKTIQDLARDFKGLLTGEWWKSTRRQIRLNFRRIDDRIRFQRYLMAEFPTIKIMDLEPEEFEDDEDLEDVPF